MSCLGLGQGLGTQHKVKNAVAGRIPQCLVLRHGGGGGGIVGIGQCSISDAPGTHVRTLTCVHTLRMILYLTFDLNLPPTS